MVAFLRRKLTYWLGYMEGRYGFLSKRRPPK